MIFFEFIVEIILEGIIGNFFKVFFSLFRKLGVLILKVITLNKTSFKKLDKEYYKDSSKPYLIVFFLVIVIAFLL
jgi:hypothetical protein